MPRRSQFPPPIKIHRARQLERCWWQGRWHYLGPVGSAEARAAYAALLAEIAAGREPGRPPPKGRQNVTGPTVSDVVSAWLAAAPTLLTARGNELAQYRMTFQPLERLFGDVPAVSFRAAQLARLREAMISGSWMTPADVARSAKRRRGGWCRRLVNQRVGRLRAVWSWAELRGLVPEGSYAALLALRPLRRGVSGVRETPEAEPATLAQLKRVAAHFPRHARPVLRAMLLVQWWGLARPGEVRTMRAGDVDASGPVWLYRPREHKTDRLGHGRQVALGPRAAAALRPWLARALAAGPDTFVFPPSRLRRGPGSCYSRAAYSRAVTRAAALAGLPGWHAYLLRHGGRDRVGRAAGDEAARAVLGHRTITTTLGYGRKVDHDHAADVQRRLG